MRKLGLFIIFILITTPCVSAMDHFPSFSEHKQSFTSKTSNDSNFTIVNLYSNSDGSLNYSTFLDYLLYTKDADQSKWILLNGSGSDLSTYTFTICNNYNSACWIS